MELGVGDVVAIRGDMRKRNDGVCQYLPGQLILNKYIKHNGHGGIWTGIVEKIDNGRALVGGGWRFINRYEVIYRTN
jgi:hypothetical protein